MMRKNKLMLIIVIFFSCQYSVDNKSITSTHNEHIQDSINITMDTIHPSNCQINTFHDLCEEAIHLSTNESKEENEGVDFIRSNELFKQAIQSVDHTFGIIFAQAFKIALKVDDINWAFELAENLAKGGVPKSFFEYYIKDPHHPRWELFYSNFTAYGAFYKSSYNFKLRQEYLNVIRKDSLFNDQLRHWFNPKQDSINRIKYGFNPSPYKNLNFTFEQLVSKSKEISNELRRIILKHGIPSEKEIGYYMLDNKSVRLYPIEIILIHVIERGETMPQIELKKSFCNGDISRIGYIDLYNWMETFKGTTESEIQWLIDKRAKILENENS